MRRLGAPLASALGRATRVRVIYASRIDRIRAPDDAPSTVPGRTAADATEDVALEFLRDCETATLADVGDEELARLLCVRAGAGESTKARAPSSRHASACTRGTCT